MENAIDCSLTFPQPTIQIEELTAMLEAGLPFQMVRYGDGEWLSITGYEFGANVDGHHYFPEMARDLRRTLKRPHKWPYMYAISLLCGKGLNEAARTEYCPHQTNIIFRNAIEWLYANGVQIPFLKPYPIYEAFKERRLKPFTSELRNKRMVFVGPGFMRALHPAWFNFVGFVEIPEIDCYQELSRIYDDIVRAINIEQPDVIGFACGMPTKILIDRIYREVITGPSITMIDFGSVFEPCIGRDSRSRFGEEDLHQLALSNFDGLLIGDSNS